MASIFKIIGFVLTLTVFSTALPNEKLSESARNTVNTENELMDSIYSDCSRKDSVNCVKYKLFSVMDKILEKRETIDLTEGVTVVKTQGFVDAEGAPRNLNDHESIEKMFLGRIQKYLQSHTIKVELKGSDIVNAITATSRAFDDASNNLYNINQTEEARGKGKKKAKLLGPLLMAVALKGAALIPLALGAIALIAGKALLIGKLALVLSAIIGLKKLLSQEKHVTYEVVAHPHHTSSHSQSQSDSFGGSGYSSDVGSYGSGGGSHGWGRTLEGHDIVYSVLTI
uniref:CSON007696 protein n=2 Tax=Culicoides sonorensis TaxID=179676 RepID=A0A336N0N1_CULSO